MAKQNRSNPNSKYWKNKLDAKWAEMVKDLWDNKCAVCGETEKLNAHHVFTKRLKYLRWNVENGIALCPKHHKFDSYLSAHGNPFSFYLYVTNHYPSVVHRWVILHNDLIINEQIPASLTENDYDWTYKELYEYFLDFDKTDKWATIKERINAVK